jgi:hypothetical protein
MGGADSHPKYHSTLHIKCCDKPQVSRSNLVIPHQQTGRKPKEIEKKKKRKASQKRTQNSSSHRAMQPPNAPARPTNQPTNPKPVKVLAVDIFLSKSVINHNAVRVHVPLDK